MQRFVHLQFIRSNDFASDAIAWFSQGHFSHVDAIMPDGYLLGARSDTVGGTPPGVHERDHCYADKAAVRVEFSVPCAVNQMQAFHTFLYKQLNKPYDREAIWGFVVGRDWRETDSWICSELQAAALEHAGIVPKLYLAANKITPVSLALTISALPGVTHRCLHPPVRSP